MQKLMQAALCSVAALTAILNGQEFRATITGTVSDPGGAVVPKAHVRVTDIQRNTTTEADTNDSGRFNIPYLVPSHYRVAVEAPGFKRFVQDDIAVDINARIGLEVKLEIGASSEQVTVTGEATPLQTETATRGGLIPSELLNDAPNDGRNMFNMVFAMPGVYKPSTSQNNSFGIDAIGNATPSINGNAAGTSGRQWNTDVLINGISDTQASNTMVMTPALASIQEVNVLTNTYDAQYGRTGGGFVVVTTKSGTNSIHGQVFDRHYDSALAANTWSNNRLGQPKTPTTINNYGFEVDGPIFIPKILDLRNKLFFMLSLDRTPSSSLATRTATVPLPEMLTGNFSGLLASNGTPVKIYDPLTSRLGPDGKTYIRDAFGGNIIPPDRINAVGLAIAKYYPAANSAGTGPAHTNNFVGTTPEISLTPQWIGRGDYRLNDNNAFFAEYADTYYTRNGGFIWGTNAADPSTQAVRGVRGRHLTMDWSKIISPTFTFDLRAGFARAENVAGNYYDLNFNPASLGFPQSLVSQMSYLQYPQITAGNYNSQGGIGFFTGDDNYSTQASASKVIGTHTIKFGAELRLFRDTSLNPGNSSGLYNFGKNWTQANPLQGDANSGNEIAGLLLGFPTSGSIQTTVSPAYSGWYSAYYFQDDWKVSRRLTLNLGLRYDYQAPEVERYNRQANGFGLTVPSPIASAVKNAAGAQNCPACANLLGAYQFANAGGNSRYSYNPDKNDFQPRIGAAFSLNSKTVLRGGFGMYKLGAYATGPSDGFSSTTTQITSLDGNLTPLTSLSNPFPSGLVSATGTALGAATDLGLTPSILYPGFKTPTSYQVSAGFQRELPGRFVLEMSYVGNFTTALPVSVTLNQNDIPVAQLGQANSIYTQKVPNPLAGLIPNNAGLNAPTIALQTLLSPFPQYSSLTINNIPIGRNTYHGGQVIVTRRFANGLTFMANYMKSKTLDELQFLNVQNFNVSDPGSSHLDKRLTPFDVAQRVSILGTYELPFGRGKRFGSSLPRAVNYALGNWKLGWNISDQSGFPIDFPNAAPLTNQSARLSGDGQSIYHWFNTALFPKTAQAPFTLRNYPSRFPDVRFPGVHNVDFSVLKDFPIKERLRAQVRADFTNAFNHPFFTKMQSLDVTSSSFGQLQLSQSNDPRVVYLDFKLIF